MIKLFPRSLFGRNLFLLAGFAIVAGITSVTGLMIVQRPRAADVGHLVAVELNTMASVFAQTPADQREKYLSHLDQVGRLTVQRAAPPAEAATSPLSLVGQFVRALRANLSPDIEFRWAGDPVPRVWVSMVVGGERYWFTLPAGTMPRDRPIAAGLILSLAMILLALLVAVVIQRHINRPLREFGEAARKLGRGQPERLPDYQALELDAVARQFNEMADNLHAMEATRIEMLAGISHDIRTPLTKLRLALAMNGAAHDTPEVGYIDQIDAIVSQFLDYGRGGAGENVIDADLNTLVRQLAGEFEAREHPFVLTLGHVPPFRFRPTSMLRLVSNLMENAVRYGGTGLEVRTRYDAGQVHIDVLDRGPGIPAEQIAHLLRPFTRADAGRSKVPGTGLGLAIVDRLARLHGGSLRVVQREGGGLKACVSMPLSAAS